MSKIRDGHGRKTLGFINHYSWVLCSITLQNVFKNVLQLEAKNIPKSTGQRIGVGEDRNEMWSSLGWAILMLLCCLACADMRTLDVDKYLTRENGAEEAINLFLYIGCVSLL